MPQEVGLETLLHAGKPVEFKLTDNDSRGKMRAERWGHTTDDRSPPVSLKESILHPVIYM